MRNAIIALSILLGTTTPAMAQVSVTVSIPGVSIGIHQPAYPDLVLVPGTPVYYAPQAQANYFFYDGLYWVFQDDNWYASSWYNGPWDLVDPDDVPLFVLRVPVQYYLRPPVFFHTWIVTAPPRWHYHWGPRWTRYHHGWDHWDRHAIPAPAPLPVYQRYYHGDRYPRREYQRVIRHEHYRYQPRDQIVRRHEQQRAAPRPQVHGQAHNRPAQPGRDPRQEQRPQRDRENMRRPEPSQAQPQQRGTPAQAERPQRLGPERQVQSPVQQSPQASRSRPDTPRAQRAPREREQMQRTGAPQQQRAAVTQERQQERQQQLQRQEQAPRAQGARPQQAPRPQQAQGQPGRGEASQPRAGAGQRQGPRPDQGQERGGRDRGQGQGRG